MMRVISRRLFLIWRPTQKVTVNRNLSVYTPSGGVKPVPRRLKFPIPRVLCTVLPALALGGYVACKLAYYLDKYDWFTPDEDDDDDD